MSIKSIMFNRKFFTVASLLLATSLASSCRDDDDVTKYYPEGVTSTAYFDYSTIVAPTVSVSYTNLGLGDGVTTSVHFALYAENPLVESEDGPAYLRDDVYPFFTGQTRSDGSWEGNVEIPSYATTIYSYAPGAPLTKVIEAPVTDGTVTISDASTTRSTGIGWHAPLIAAPMATPTDAATLVGVYGIRMNVQAQAQTGARYVGTAQVYTKYQTTEKIGTWVNDRPYVLYVSNSGYFAKAAMPGVGGLTTNSVTPDKYSVFSVVRINGYNYIYSHGLGRFFVNSSAYNYWTDDYTKATAISTNVGGTNTTITWWGGRWGSTRTTWTWRTDYDLSAFGDPRPENVTGTQFYYLNNSGSTAGLTRVYYESQATYYAPQYEVYYSQNADRYYVATADGLYLTTSGSGLTFTSDVKDAAAFGTTGFETGSSSAQPTVNGRYLTRTSAGALTVASAITNSWTVNFAAAYGTTAAQNQRINQINEIENLTTDPLNTTAYLTDNGSYLGVSTSNASSRYAVFKSTTTGAYFLYSISAGKFLAGSDFHLTESPLAQFTYTGNLTETGGSGITIKYDDRTFYIKPGGTSALPTVDLTLNSTDHSQWIFTGEGSIDSQSKAAAIAKIFLLEDVDGAYGDGKHFCKAVHHTGISGNTITDPWASAQYKPKEWKTWLGLYSTTCNSYLWGKASQGIGGFGNNRELPGTNWLNYMSSFSGSFTELCGGVDYANVFASEEDRQTLQIGAADVAEMLEIHSQVLPVDVLSSDRQFWGANQTLTFAEDAGIAVTFLASLSGTSAGLAYYYYEGDTPPATVDQLNPILIFPNVQDGAWNYVGQQAGTARGTQVQLYYFGPSTAMSKEKKSRTFPAGTTIGFMFMGRAWTDNPSKDVSRATASADGSFRPHNRWGFNDNRAHYSTTTKGIASGVQDVPDSNGEFSGGALYAPDQEHVIFSFEDGNADYNCSDCVFALRTNPLNAFTGVKVEEGITTTQELAPSAYFFEDIWPGEGDYDLNDVVVQVNPRKETQKFVSTTSTAGHVWSVETATYLRSETSTLRFFENYAELDNGIAVELKLGSGIEKSNVAEVELLYDGETRISAQRVVETATGWIFYITDKIHEGAESEQYVCKINPDGSIKQAGHTIDVKVRYYSPKDDATNAVNLSGETAIGQSTVTPFIYRWNDASSSKTWEVHIPYEAPSPLNVDYKTNYSGMTASNFTYLMHQDDGSDVASGRFYIRNHMDNDYRPYPFAFRLAGAGVINANGSYANNLYKVLLPDNERKRIDVLFPNFINWVNDHLTTKAGTYDAWYK